VCEQERGQEIHDREANLKLTVDLKPGVGSSGVEYSEGGRHVRCITQDLMRGPQRGVGHSKQLHHVRWKGNQESHARVNTVRPGEEVGVLLKVQASTNSHAELQGEL
jgi:hypothetical protein